MNDLVILIILLNKTIQQDIEERRALKADQTTPADNGVVESSKDGATEKDAAEAKTAPEGESSTPMITDDPDVKPRRRDEERRGSGRRKESGGGGGERRRRGDSRDRLENGGQHHQVAVHFITFF